DGWQWISGAPFDKSFPWGINDKGKLQGGHDGKQQDCMILKYFPIQDEQEYADNRCQKENDFICEKPEAKKEIKDEIKALHDAIVSKKGEKDITLLLQHCERKFKQIFKRSIDLSFILDLELDVDVPGVGPI
ncbi:unnamed protein product, partial [Meganyctiphanes norvegica]